MLIQMIVVVVAHKDNVNFRKFGNRTSWRSESFWSDELERGGSIREDRIYE